MRSISVKVLVITLAVAALPLASWGDVPKPPASVDTAKSDLQREEALTNYRRGVQLAEGDGVEKDETAAAKFYREAAEAGFAPAQYALACLYAGGRGMKRDLKQAAFWYRKAADQGDPEAQNNLGALYAKGQGVRRSYRQAVRWYGLSAEQKDPEATSNLGAMRISVAVE